ncbi:hypothetical protein L484_006051 [Morus notabilis]|uniref:Uncharacterized protein n=1 Tax=Morus notabilis TaxID=981085 RepID=W9QQN6_9ROSA|nr:uncharacterized protein LOC21389498 [Morus notabilis]EXB37903.1 hypothetical protein L484_006051 [Morus notabilis]
MTRKQIVEKLHVPARPLLGDGAKIDQRRQHGLVRHKINNSTVSSSSASSSRLLPTFSTKNQVPASTRSVQCRHRYGYAAPRAVEVLIKRALTPPKRRFTLRWWSFRPTLSRLSNMSTA